MRYCSPIAIAVVFLLARMYRLQVAQLRMTRSSGVRAPHEYEISDYLHLQQRVKALQYFIFFSFKLYSDDAWFHQEKPPLLASATLASCRCSLSP
ncbi:hypothetical protein F5148DRAFT_1209556 [Russula earlei]|uniref:Uncharacterized protein n=1 Tax=Russula earlei TaxID=71964 RepID=A0ACC0U5V4_9AGAM|nr:hypothetical protein F5148DRAFT_1209556 [Russula earlei]